MNAIPDATTLPKPMRVDPRRSAQPDRALAKLRPQMRRAGEKGSS